MLLQIVAKLIDRHLVDACATFVALHLPQCFLQIPSLTYFLHDPIRIGWAFGLISGDEIVRFLEAVPSRGRARNRGLKSCATNPLTRKDLLLANVAE